MKADYDSIRWLYTSIRELSQSLVTNLTMDDVVEMKENRKLLKEEHDNLVSVIEDLQALANYSNRTLSLTDNYLKKSIVEVKKC